MFKVRYLALNLALLFGGVWALAGTASASCYSETVGVCSEPKLESPAFSESATPPQPTDLASTGLDSGVLVLIGGLFLFSGAGVLFLRYTRPED
jgi:hypothetical protein